MVWTPDESLVGSAALTDFARRVGHPGSYQELWQWSRDDLEGFWQAVVDHFLHTIIPTEAFVHTVLANSGLRLSNDHRRYAVFDPPSSASPRVFGLEDVEALLATGANFARKFDDVRVLDAIDRHIL